MSDATPRASDVVRLRRTVQLADAAVAAGDHPFGALLLGEDGDVLVEAGNTFSRDGGPGHAESNVLRDAARRLSPATLARCTLYTSVEPCCMCAGSLYWSGVGALVYGITERRLAALTGDHAENPTLDLPCRHVFAAGRRPIVVRGPFDELEELIVAQHAAFW